MQTARAEIVTFRVDGTLTSISDPGPVSPLPASVGQGYSLVYSFESTTPGHRDRTTPPEILRYDAIIAVTLFIGDNVYALPRVAAGEIIIQDDLCQPFGGCADDYHIVASNSIVDPLFFQLQLGLSQTTTTPGNALTSLLLPLTPPDRAAFDIGSVRFLYSIGGGTNQSASLSGSISSISAVPVPAALWLLSSALMGGAAFRRRATRRLV